MPEKLAKDRAGRGLVIVSGLAGGIDSCARKGALRPHRGATNVIDELREPIRAEFLPVETARSEERAPLVEKDLASVQGTWYDLLGLDEFRHVDDLVGLSRFSSSEVLAAPFDLERKGVACQLPGKQFLPVLF
jgi:hypothetical protein